MTRVAVPPKYSPEEIERRLAALADARANNAMEGLYESAADAAALDQYARGAIDRTEFDRRIRTNLHAATTRRAGTSTGWLCRAAQKTN